MYAAICTEKPPLTNLTIFAVKTYKRHGSIITNSRSHAFADLGNARAAGAVTLSVPSWDLFLSSSLGNLPMPQAMAYDIQVPLAVPQGVLASRELGNDVGAGAWERGGRSER